MRVKISRKPAEAEWLEWLMRRELNPRPKMASIP